MRIARLAVILIFSVAAVALARAQAPGSHVIVITLDGLRWQEFFGGADRDYFKKGKNGEAGASERRFWRASQDERRAALMPFMWTTVAREGQILGDPSKNSRVHVTNGLWFSYPGYNELLAGAPDPRVNSNDKVPNPNVTVLEWLNGRPAFTGQVVAFGAWDVLPFILNTARSRIPVGTGFEPVPSPATDRQREINQLARDVPTFWDYGTVDAPMIYAAWDAMRTTHPRVVYVMLGEGDEWAHQGRYDQYLDATRRADDFIRRTWELAQSLPEYKDHTTILMTTDHGRGATTKDWNDHGRDVPAAENTWMAALGAAVPGLGVREGMTVTTAQFAATIAAAVGEDFRAAHGAVAPAVPFAPK
jgi:hypothetical protein